MKIYKKIVYDKYDNIIEEDSYEYHGQIAKAGDIIDDAVDVVTDFAKSDIGQLVITAAVAYFAGPLAAEGSFLSTAIGQTAAKIVVGVASSMVMGAVGKALAPKIDPPSFGTTLEQGISVTTKSPTASYRIVYGETRVGGTIVYAETTSDTNEFLHMVIVVAGHEIDDIPTIYLGEDVISLETNSNDSNGIPIFTPTSSDEYNGKLQIKKHFGDDSQLADANLVADVTQWTTNHKISGKAYVYVRLQFDSDVYPNGVPNFHVLLKVKSYLTQEQLALQLLHLLFQHHQIR